MAFDEAKAAALLRLHEGETRLPYKDSVGKLTIGVGFNLDDVGLYPEEIDFILRRRLNILKDRLRTTIPEYRHFNCTRQIVLVDMAYNLGLKGLMKFKKMLAALALEDYKLAASEMLDSKWAQQVGGRSVRLARMMETGEWYEDS